MYDAANRILILFVLLFIFSPCQGNAANDGGLISPKSTSDMSGVLPEWLGEQFSRSSSTHFHVAHDGGSVRAEELSEELESAFDRFYLFFERLGFELQSPQKKLGWVYFSDPERFGQYALRADRMDLSHLKGYYSSRTNRVAIAGPHFGLSVDAENPLPAPSSEIAAMAVGDRSGQIIKIAHELAHQLAFNAGLQKRGVMYPLWVSEGLATQYETALSYGRDSNRARCDRLAQMRDHGRLIPVSEFITITRLPAEQLRCEELYAQAWGLFNYLSTHRTAELRDFLRRLYAGRPGFRKKEAFYKDFILSFGPIDQLHPNWVDAVCDSNDDAVMTP